MQALLFLGSIILFFGFVVANEDNQDTGFMTQLLSAEIERYRGRNDSLAYHAKLVEYNEALKTNPNAALVDDFLFQFGKMEGKSLKGTKKSIIQYSKRVRTILRNTSSGLIRRELEFHKRTPKARVFVNEQEDKVSEQIEIALSVHDEFVKGSLNDTEALITNTRTIAATWGALADVLTTYYGDTINTLMPNETDRDALARAQIIDLRSLENLVKDLCNYLSALLELTKAIEHLLSQIETGKDAAKRATPTFTQEFLSVYDSRIQKEKMAVKLLAPIEENKELLEQASQHTLVKMVLSILRNIIRLVLKYVVAIIMIILLSIFILMLIAIAFVNFTWGRVSKITTSSSL